MTISTISNEYLYKFQLSIRRQLPRTPAFYMIFYFLKYFTVILSTHSITPNRENDSDFTLSKILGFFVIMKKNPKIDYPLICEIIYLVLTFLILSFVSVFVIYHLKSKKTDQKIFGIPKNNLDLKRWVKVLQKINCGVLTFVAFIYQHLIEILFLGIFYALSNELSGSKLDKEIKLPSYGGKYIFCGLNFFFIIVLIMILYLYLIMISSLTFTHKFGTQVTNAHSEIIIKLIIFSLQGIYSSTFYFEIETRKKVHLYLCFFSLGLLFIDFLISLKQINFGTFSITSFFNKFITNFCIISGIIEICVYYLIKDKKTTDQKYYVFILIIEILNSAILTWLISHMLTRITIKKIAKNLFITNKPCNIDLLFEVLLNLKKISTQQEKYLFIMKIIQTHQSTCTFEVCICHKYEQYWNSLKTVNKLEKINHKFISLCEKRIVSTIIGQITTSKAVLCKALYFHCIFLYSIKKNISLCYYLCHFYLLKRTGDLNYQHSYLLYELGWCIKHYEKANWKHNDLLFLREVFSFEKIKKILAVLCTEFEKILYFKRLKNSNAKMLFTCQDILNSLNSFISDNKKLSYILNNYSKHTVFGHSPEIQFLLFYYVRLFHIYLPRKIKSKIYSGSIEYPSYIELSDTTSDNNKLKNNTVILFLNQENKFIIRYMSIEICEELQYERNEIIGSDFNEVLIPKTISQFHTLYMKEYSLLGYSEYIKNTFLIDQSGKMCPVKVIVKILPTTSAMFAMITNFEFIQSVEYSNYYVMSDIFNNIICISESFENQFAFGVKMLQALKINICDFFCLNKEKINNYFHAKLNEMYPTTPEKQGFKPASLTTIRNEEKYYYQSIPGFTMKFHTSKDGLEEELVKFEVVKKDKILNSIIKLGKNIEELGLEKEWKSRINDLYNKFNSKFVVLEEASYARMGTRKTNNVDSSPTYNNVGNFFIKFEYKIIGNFHYYIITISELKSELISHCKTHKGVGDVSSQSQVFIAEGGNVVRPVGSFQGRNPAIEKSSSFLNSFHFETGDSLFPFESSMRQNLILNTNTTQNMPSSAFNDTIKDSSSSELITDLAKSKQKQKFDTGKRQREEKLSLSLNRLENLTKLLPWFKLFEYLILLTMFCINIYYFVGNSTSIEASLIAFYASTYSFLIVNDIYYGSLSCISYCLYQNGIQKVDGPGIQVKIERAAQYLIDHHILFQSFINQMQNNDQMKEIYLIYNENDVFTQLLPNWSIHNKSSSLIEEVYFIHYSFRQFGTNYFGTNTNFCRIKENFFDMKFKNFGDDIPEEDYATDEEKFIFYLFENLLTKITEKLERLVKTANTILKKDSDDSNYSSLLIGVVFIFIAFVLFILVLVSLLISKRIFRQKMRYLFTEHENENLFLDEIKKFHRLVDSFSRTESDEYVCFKRGIFFSSEISYSKKDNLTFMGKRITSMKVPGVGVKAKKSSFVNSTKVGRKGKEKSTKKLRKEVIQKTEVVDEVKQESTEQQFEEKTKPRYLTVSLVVLCLVFSGFFAEEISSTITSVQSYEQTVVENDFSTNFLQRIPKFYELFLYAIISVIKNDAYFIQKEKSEYDDNILSNYFKVKIDFSTNSYFKRLGNSNYARLYYQLEILRSNLRYLISDKRMDAYLKDTRNKENTFNRNEDFCYFPMYYYFLIEYPDITPKEFFVHLNQATEKCESIGNGVNLNGYSASADFMQQQMTNNYFSFIESKSPDRQIEFLNNTDLLTIEENFIYVFQYLHLSDAFLIIDDVYNTYDVSHGWKVFFSVASICFSGGFIFVMMLIIITKMDNYNSVLREIVKMFENSMKKYNTN